MLKRSQFFAAVGLVTAIIILSVFLFIWFKYDVHQNQVLILNISNENSAYLDTMCHFNKNVAIVEKGTIEKLQKANVLLSPQEYTQNVINYYNTLLSFVAIGIAALGVFLFFHIQNITNEQVQVQVDKLVTEKLRESSFIHRLIRDNIFGELDQEFVKQEEYDKKIELHQSLLDELEIGLYGEIEIETKPYK